MLQNIYRLYVSLHLLTINKPNLCNGGDKTAELREHLPICPECAETQSCSEKELLARALGVCESTCKEIGLTLFPDNTRTEIYGTVNLGCPTKLFDPPNLSESKACLVKGSLPQIINLAGAYALRPSKEVDGNESNQYVAEYDLAPISSCGALGSTWNYILAGFAVLGLLYENVYPFH